MEIKPQDYLHFYVGQWVTVTSLSGLAIAAGFELGRYALNFEMLHYILSGRMGIRNSLELRPLSDMTEEEKVQLHNYMFPNGIGIKRSDSDKRCFIEYALDLQMSDLSNHAERVMSVITIHSITKMVNWLRKNSFDADGLIPAGLAIDKTSLKN